jgi:hypothetical protein
MYVGDEAQVFASPADVPFKWTSDNEQIATVTQTGLIKALGEGLATVSIEYGEYEPKKVDVRSRIFIPMTGIRVLVDSVEIGVGESTQIWVYPVPEDASEVPTAIWRSENPEIATVDQDGIVTSVSRGTTNVVVSFVQSDGSVFEKTIKVKGTVIELIDKTDCKVIAWSDEQAGGGEVVALIDNDYSNLWHSKYINGISPFPHWAIVDMLFPRKIAKIDTYRWSTLPDAKTVLYYVSNDPDPNAVSWTKIAEGVFVSGNMLTLQTSVSIYGRYLKIYLPDTNRSPYVSIAEIDVYEIR